MGTTLGINDDKWHFILAFFGSIGAFLLLYYLIPWGENPALEVLLPIVLSAGLMFMLQYFYESYQAAHWDGNYKSYGHFLENSRKDWRYFWYGLFAAQFINGLLGGLIL